MARWHGKSERKPSGGRRIRHRGKRRSEMGNDTQPTMIGEEKRQHVRARGGETKVRALRTNIANVTDPSTGETVRAEIKTVSKNEANVHYVRRNFVTKGAIIETDKGKARVTSRPGQTGQVNAVLVD